MTDKPDSERSVMKITICDINPALERHWPWNIDGVTVKSGSIFDEACDAYVSPANSFGFMDGGIDLIYSQKMGWHVQERVREAIAARPLGELLVGEALIVPTDYERAPHLIVAPTMRVPRPISDLKDVYLAARAAVMASLQAGFSHIAMPGLGTGAGFVPFDVAAKLMVRGIIDARNPPRPPKSWRWAYTQQMTLASS